MGDVGRNTILTKEVFAKIKEGVFLRKNIKELAEFSGISLSTFYTWHSDNYLMLADKVDGWRRDSKLEKADVKLDEILDLDASEKEFTPSVLKAAMFIKETLDKEFYSKRSELTGRDGKDLPTPILTLDVQRNDSDEESQSTEETD